MADLTVDRGVIVLRRRARWLTVLLPLHAAMSVSLIALQLATGQTAAGPTTGQDDPGLLMASGLLGLAVLVSLVATIALAAMWTYRANANLHAARAEGLEFTPGWAAGWYFVPFANLVKPFQAMREIWNRSRLDDDGLSREAPGRLQLWWGLWIVGGALANAGWNSPSPVFGPVHLVGEVLLGAGALTYLAIIREISATQDQRLLSHQVFA